MHLPVETLKSVAAHLSRADLGRLQQVNIVLNVAKSSRRYIFESEEGTLTAVRTCHYLELCYLNQLPDPAIVSVWLRRATAWPGPKRLKLRADWVDCAPLVTHLRETFEASDRPCPYRVEIRALGDYVGDDCLVNKLANECLTIASVPQDGVVVVERKPVE
ncbi:hypothetical protein AAVH_02234 [Aphelenchoides avenae]|nr:hypothetical protein AAVH_02232 [Aphelenchus avenae]KAH7729760.1 hypothetical protein AAVH_02234 [Aphelenchus avenae]